jgi:hypothetical protein
MGQSLTAWKSSPKNENTGRSSEATCQRLPNTTIAGMMKLEHKLMKTVTVRYGFSYLAGYRLSVSYMGPDIP